MLGANNRVLKKKKKKSNRVLKGANRKQFRGNGVVNPKNNKNNKNNNDKMGDGSNIWYGKNQPIRYQGSVCVRM